MNTTQTRDTDQNKAGEWSSNRRHQQTEIPGLNTKLFCLNAYASRGRQQIVKKSVRNATGPISNRNSLIGLFGTNPLQERVTLFYSMRGKFDARYEREICAREGENLALHVTIFYTIYFHVSIINRYYIIFQSINQCIRVLFHFLLFGLFATAVTGFGFHNYLGTWFSAK